MTAVPTPQELVSLPDAELQQLAIQWRARAAHGVRDAFGVAHAFEVEARRRAREAHRQSGCSVCEMPPRGWWKALFASTRGGATLSHSHT